MSFPTDPLDLRTELFVNNAWTDITSDVYLRGGVNITRGRANESAKLAPAKCRFQINNRSGKYSPRNPMGAYYGSLGRNTPVRMAVRTGRDTFTRSVTNGWGSADTGQAWVLTGAGGTVQSSDWQVASGKGTQSVPATSAYRLSFAELDVYRDVDVAITVTLPFTDVTGGSVEPANVALRGQATDKYYFARVVINTAEQVTIALHRFNGSETIIAAAVTVPGLVHSSSQPLRVRAQIEGQTIRAKVWAASGAEPYGWHVTAHDEVINGTGWIGVRSGVAGGNTNTPPVVFSYDDLEVRVPRFAGEVASWPPRWDTSGKDAYVPIEASGITRRLGQGANPLKSAPQRFIEQHATQPKVYYPLDDLEGSLAGKVAIGTAMDAAIRDWSPSTGHPVSQNLARFFAQGKLGYWLRPSLSIQDDTVVVCKFPDAVFAATSWTAHAVLQFDGAYQSGILDSLAVFDTPGTVGWQFWLYSFSKTIELVFPVTFPAPVIASPSGNLFDGGSHHLTLRVAQNGANADWNVYVDGVLLASGAEAGYTVVKPTQIQFHHNATPTPPRSIGHIAVYDGSGPTITDITNAVFGHVGQTAGRRIERLCADSDIPFSYVGDLDSTAQMGPQGRGTLLELLQECADADRGTLYETRGQIGLEYRARSSMYNQAAAVSLSLSSGHLSPPFAPVDDDQLTRNDITAKRESGGTYQVEKTTGRLSVLDPSAGGVGRYDTSVPVNVKSDTQLPDIAAWQLHLSTVDESRFPQLHLDLARNATLQTAVMGINLDDRLTLTGATAQNIYDQVSQLARGSSEKLNAYQHDITLNCAPESPYRVPQLDDATLGRLDTAGSVLSVAIDSDDAALSVATTAERVSNVFGDADTFLGPYWTTDATQFPFSWMIGGEEVSVTDLDDELITFVGVGTAAHADNANITPGLPAGYQAGDVLVLLTAQRNLGAGATSTDQNYSFLSLANHVNLRVFGKIAGASEVAPLVSFAGGAAGDTTSAQIAAFRGKFHNVRNLVVAQRGHENPSAQDIAYPFIKPPFPNCLILYIGWKQDDWTSVVSPGTEIAEPSSILGNDQGLVWAYTIQTTATDVASGSFTVTGGAAAVSRGTVLAIRCDRQAATVTRSINGVVKSHAAGATVELAPAHRTHLGL